MQDNQAVARRLLAGLIDFTPGLSVLFCRDASAQEQSALFVALELLPWGPVWRLLFEELRVQRRLDDASIRQTVDVVRAKQDPEELRAAIGALSARLGTAAADGSTADIDGLAAELARLIRLLGAIAS